MVYYIILTTLLNVHRDIEDNYCEDVHKIMAKTSQKLDLVLSFFCYINVYIL